MLGNKELVFANVRDGEEVNLKKVREAFSTCWVHNGAVEITSDIQLIKMVENGLEDIHTILVHDKKVPTVTKKSTRRLMRHYCKKRCVNTKVIKEFIYHMFDKKYYKVPYISPEALFLPIQGDSNKHSSYINLAMVDQLYAVGPYKTVIRFCNGFELEVDMKFSTVKKHANRCLEIYAMYYECDNDFGVNCFTKWTGSYYQQRKELINAAVKKAKEKNASAIKTKCKFMHTSTDSDKMEIAERAFYS